MNGHKPIKHVCLITPGNLSSTPRLLREAQALRDHQYQVTIISGNLFPPLDTADKDLAKENNLRLIQVGAKGVSWLVMQVSARLCHLIARASLPLSSYGYALALTPLSSLLLIRAYMTKADLYIGHCMAGLYVAVTAARRHSAKAGFDVEDFHETEQKWPSHHQWMQRSIRNQLNILLPCCQHLTAASPGIATAIETQYGRTPTSILNAYSLEEAPAHQVDMDTPGHSHPAKLYWFSQTIGPGRGIEKALQAMAKMKTPSELYLRGFIEESYQQALVSLAQSLNLSDQLIFLSPGKADEMVTMSAGYHLGLCLEEPSPQNRDICLTNKIFAYLLAGTPVWLSKTSAHINLYPEIKMAACMTNTENANESAEHLDHFFNHSECYQVARHHAFHLGRTIYNWEVESEKFLNSVQSSLNHSHYE